MGYHSTPRALGFHSPSHTWEEIFGLLAVGCSLLVVLVVLMVVWCGTMYDKETCAVRPLGCVSGKETTGTSCIDWYDREATLVFVAYFIASKSSKQTCRHTDAQLPRERYNVTYPLQAPPPCSFTYTLQVNTPSNKDLVVNNRTIINHSVLLRCVVFYPIQYIHSHHHEAALYIYDHRGWDHLD